MTIWLEGLDLPFKQPLPDPHTLLAVRVWNLMHGQIDWQALNTVTDLVGITDIELLIAQLDTIRTHGNQSSTD